MAEAEVEVEDMKKERKEEVIKAEEVAMVATEVVAVAEEAAAVMVEGMTSHQDPKFLIFPLERSSHFSPITSDWALKTEDSSICTKSALVLR